MERVDTYSDTVGMGPKKFPFMTEALKTTVWMFSPCLAPSEVTLQRRLKLNVSLDMYPFCPLMQPLKLPISVNHFSNLPASYGEASTSGRG